MGYRKEIIVWPFSITPWYYLFARIKASMFLHFYNSLRDNEDVRVSVTVYSKRTRILQEYKKYWHNYQYQ